METSDLDNRFTYHAPDDDKAVTHQAIRDVMLSTAGCVNVFCPEGREKSLAITKLEEAMFWANAAIARAL